MQAVIFSHLPITELFEVPPTYINANQFDQCSEFHLVSSITKYVTYITDEYLLIKVHAVTELSKLYNFLFVSN